MSEVFGSLFSEELMWMARYGPGEKCYACGQEPNDPPHQLWHRFAQDESGRVQRIVECEVTRAPIQKGSKDE